VPGENSKAPKRCTPSSPGRPAGRRGAAAQHGVDARHELARVEGLGQVVVGAHLQADDAVHLVALGGEHDDGGRAARGAQAPADREPVLARQHQVEHQQVVALARELPVHRLRVGHRAHLELLLAEVAREQVAQALVVVDHEDAGLQLGHGVTQCYRKRGRITLSCGLP
jgi:hypothetical protein